MRLCGRAPHSYENIEYENSHVLQIRTHGEARTHAQTATVSTKQFIALESRAKRGKYNHTHMRGLEENRAHAEI